MTLENKPVKTKYSWQANAAYKNVSIKYKGITYNAKVPKYVSCLVDSETGKAKVVITVMPTRDNFLLQDYGFDRKNVSYLSYGEVIGYLNDSNFPIPKNLDIIKKGLLSHYELYRYGNIEAFIMNCRGLLYLWTGLAQG